MRIKEYLMKFLRPSLYISGLDYFLKLWNQSDAKERGILLLVFSPMFICTGGLIFSIIYFVLFVLPSFLFGILGWGLLAALFGAGGRYCFKYFTGKEIPVDEYKSQFSYSSSSSSSSSSRAGRTERTERDMHEVIEAQIVDTDDTKDTKK